MAGATLPAQPSPGLPPCSGCAPATTTAAICLHGNKTGPSASSHSARRVEGLSLGDGSSSTVSPSFPGQDVPCVPKMMEGEDTQHPVGLSHK